jgi:hypothetical protein
LKYIGDENLKNEANSTLISQKSIDSNRSGTQLWAAAKQQLQKKVLILVTLFYLNYKLNILN